MKLRLGIKLPPTARPPNRWVAFTLLMFLISLGGASGASAGICLPPVFEGGKRLLRVGETRMVWIDPLLRQHEVCWRRAATPDEKRIFVFGNSGIFGFPVAAEDTSVAEINRSFARDDVPAHVYNLGYVFSYQIKDALIMRESLEYEPDVIVYAATLADFVHIAPIWFPPLIEFFKANTRALSRFAGEHPRGLDEPLARYRGQHSHLIRPRAPWFNLRDAGKMLRVAASEWAREIRQAWFPSTSFVPPRKTLHAKYKCSEVKRKFETQFADWHLWNPLAYLDQIREETGAEIVVVNWPVAPDRQGECYNARYTTKALGEFGRWIRGEAERRGLHYVDLQNALPRGEFVDSAHLNAAGHRRVAGLLGEKLREVVQSPERSHQQWNR